MMTTRASTFKTAPSARREVLLDPIAAGTWRVLDYRDGNTGIDVLVGFVQRTSNAYAVTRLSRPDEQRLCRDLAEVQELFSTPDHPRH
jgi:hypothetical protein